MIKIEPNVVYTKRELGKMFKGHVEADTLFERLGLRGRTVFRDCILGQELLDAWAKAPRFSEASKAEVIGIPPSCGGGRGRASGGPVRKLGVRDLED